MRLFTKTLAAATIISAAMLPAVAADPGSSAAFRVKGTTRAEAAPEAPLTEKPAGTSTIYSRDSFTYFIMMGMAISSEDHASAVEVIDGDDGYVYIGNPFASIQTGTWLKGKREEGKIVVELPQLIYTVDYEGERSDYYAYRMELKGEFEDDDKWYYPTDSQRLEYICNEDGFHMEGADNPKFLFGLCDKDGGWVGNGDVRQSCRPADTSVISDPAGGTVLGWQATYNGDGHFISCAESGNDIYIKGLAKDFPDVWIKGTRTAGGIHFPSGQYLGVDNATCHHNFLTGTAKESFWSEEYEMELQRNVLADNIDFEESDGVLAFSGNILVNKGMQSYLPLATYSGMTMRATPDEIVPYPADPTLNTLIQYDESWGYGALLFNLPRVNMDGYLLPVEDMYYEIYVNGEPWPLYSDEYPGIEDETYLVPYTYNDGQYLMSYGVPHTFYFFMWDFDTIGVQSVYKKGDQYYGSQQVYYILNDNGVESTPVETLPVDSTEWYDLSGRRLSAPGTGICIRITRYSDGTVKAEKVAGSNP